MGRTAGAEIPGPIEAHYQIPDRLAGPGVHLLAVRTSAFHRHFNPRRGYWAVLLGDYDSIAALNTRSSLWALMALSGIILTGAFGMAMFVTRRDRTYLLLGSLCVAAAALLIAEKWRPLFGYTYDFHIVRLLIIAFLSYVVGLHVVALTAARFPIKHGPRVFFTTAAIAAAGPFVVPGWDTKAVFIFLVCFVTSLVWAVGAVRRKRPAVCSPSPAFQWPCWRWPRSPSASSTTASTSHSTSGRARARRWTSHCAARRADPGAARARLEARLAAELQRARGLDVCRSSRS